MSFCFNCNKKININRGFLNLFKKSYFQSICENCLKRHPMLVKSYCLPKVNGLVYVISLLKDDNSINVNSYMQNLKPIYDFFLNNNINNNTLIILDYLDLETFELIQQIDYGNVLLITHKIKTKEDNYEI